MPMIGFDDERVRDGWWEEEAERWVRLSEAVGPMESALAALRQEIGELVEAIVEVFRPVVEAIIAVGEAAIRAVEEAWALIRVVEETRPADRPPLRHYNCRCLPVERVDPVKAGRTRWWTRK